MEVFDISVIQNIHLREIIFFTVPHILRNQEGLLIEVVEEEAQQVVSKVFVIIIFLSNKVYLSEIF